MTLLTFFTGSALSGDISDTTLHSEKVYGPVIVNDTVELLIHTYNESEQNLSIDKIASVGFRMRKPDGTTLELPASVTDEGAAFLRFDETDQIGPYKWVVQFEFNSGEKSSFVGEFVTYDPLIGTTQTQNEQISEQVWMRLEDCFDSELGGPWLRDQTLAYFDKHKVGQFIPEGLMRINNWPPLTTLDLGYFTTPVPDPDPALPLGTLQPDPDRIIIVQATLLSVIRHLMRSYVEQPDPQGANIVWRSRRDYLQRWSSIYELEETAFKEMVALWKRQFYHFGKGALLVHSKAGRLYPPGFRVRNASRGYT